MSVRDRKLARLVLDHLAGKPGMIQEIIKYRRSNCKEARAYQIVNEFIHAALGYVPLQKHSNYEQVRHPNLIGYGLRTRYDNGNNMYDENTPEGFYRREIDCVALMEYYTHRESDVRLSLHRDLKP